jgi:hypothetical protein
MYQSQTAHMHVRGLRTRGHPSLGNNNTYPHNAGIVQIETFQTKRISGYLNEAPTVNRIYYGSLQNVAQVPIIAAGAGAGPHNKEIFNLIFETTLPSIVNQYLRIRYTH